jgi:hypothetical protein
VHRHLSPSIALLLALVMCAPSLRDAYTGAVTLDTLLVRIILALGVGWIAVAVVNRVVTGYAPQAPAPVPELEATQDA